LVLVLLVWLLGSLLLASSVFSDVNDWLIGVRGFYVLHVLGHLTIIGAAFSLPSARRQILGQRAILISVIGYGALVAASTEFNTTGTVPFRLVQAVLIPTTIVSLAICLPSIFSPSGYRTLFRIVIVILSVSSVASLVLMAVGADHVLGRELSHWGAYRGGRFAASGLFVNPNALGSLLEFFPAIIVYLIYAERRHVVAHAVAFALIAVHLVLTFSRSAMGVAIVSLLPLAPGVVRRRRRLAYALAAVALVVLVVVWRMDSWYLDLDLALRSRNRIWSLTLARVQEKPLLGFGLLNVTLPVNLNVNPGGQTAHNLYLAQVLYFGWVGFVAFITMSVAFGRRVYASLADLAGSPGARVLTAALIGVAWQGLLEYIITFPLFFTNSLFWIVLGMVANKKL
jgi:O-antigen ligase